MLGCGGFGINLQKLSIQAKTANFPASVSETKITEVKLIPLIYPKSHGLFLAHS